MDRKHENQGRHHLLNERAGRHVILNLNKLRQTRDTFFSTDIQRECGNSEKQMSNRTVRRYLNRRAYHFEQCQKKEQLLKDDLKKRYKFALKCNGLPSEFWQKDIGFYFDGVSWAHKTNLSEHVRTLRIRTWKKKGESLSRLCTAKGRKEGTGGSVTKFFVAIAYGCL